MTFTLGVTGGIGSGKTAATDQFASHGVQVIDADVIAHQAVDIGSPALLKISDHFGKNILLSTGALNRPLLREIIFKNTQEKQWLENLLHPLIRKEITAALNKTTSTYTILSAPLLLENNLQSITDRVLVIDCDEELQIERASKRDNNSSDIIKSIMKQQLSRNDRIKKADDIITNNGTLPDLQKAVDNYHFKLLETIA